MSGPNHITLTTRPYHNEAHEILTLIGESLLIYLNPVGVEYGLETGVSGSCFEERFGCKNETVRKDGHYSVSF